MAGLAIITEACIDVKDRACVDVCPVQCIYEFDPQKNVLFSEEEAGSGVIENTHAPEPGRDRDLRRQHPVREPRGVHVVHRLLPARRLPGRRDLLRGAPARRLAVGREVQRRRTRTRATTTRSSSSTAATCSPTSWAAGQAARPPARRAARLAFGGEALPPGGPHRAVDGDGDGHADDAPADELLDGHEGRERERDEEGERGGRAGEVHAGPQVGEAAQQPGDRPGSRASRG